MRHARNDYNGRIIDLQAKIPNNEPVFLLRGQDAHAAETLRFYADLVENESPEVAEKARQHADEMDNWPTHKVPDLAVADEVTPNADNLFCFKAPKVGLPFYYSNKIKQAARIIEVVDNGDEPSILVCMVDGVLANIEIDAAYMYKHKPMASGYYVLYKDGYESFEPEKSFIESHARICT